MTLEAHDIEVQVGDATLLDGVSIRVEPGEVVAVIGPNGAGKSTLIDVLAGRRRVSTDVCLDGRPIADRPADATARRRAVLSQSVQVGFGFTVDEIMRLAGLPWRGEPNPPGRPCFDACLQAVGMTGVGDRSITTLSGGESRRVHLARILAQVAWPSERAAGRHVLLDEPLGSLDIGQRARVLGLIDEMRRGGLGVLSVFHELGAAARVSDRVIVLKDGRCLGAGPTQEVLNPKLLESCYETPVEIVRNPKGIVSIHSPLES